MKQVIPKVQSKATSNGGGYSIVGEPLTVDEESAVLWKRAKLDTDELARLRFSEGWTVKKLVEHFGYSRSQIKKELRKLEPQNIPNIDIYPKKV
ncbi:MAG: hypothetical protein ACKOA8_12585 [Deltaproteobacteria bacterium]